MWQCLCCGIHLSQHNTACNFDANIYSAAIDSQKISCVTASWPHEYDMTYCWLLLQWLKEGKVSYLDHVTDGLDNAPQAFIGMLKGENVGKAAVHVADA